MPLQKLALKAHTHEEHRPMLCLRPMGQVTRGPECNGEHRTSSIRGNPHKVEELMSSKSERSGFDWDVTCLPCEASEIQTHTPSLRRSTVFSSWVRLKDTCVYSIRVAEIRMESTHCSVTGVEKHDRNVGGICSVCQAMWNVQVQERR